MAEFSDKQREHLANTGAAMSDGSFPIRNESDLKNAIHAAGRAKHPDAVRHHIIARAKSLGKSHLIPADWHKEKNAAKFASDYSKALKYAAADVANMMPQLASPEHAGTRGGSGDQTFRNAMSDAMREEGRENEADLLANPKQHVVVRQNQIHPGKLLSDGIMANTRAVDRHLRNLSDEVLSVPDLEVETRESRAKGPFFRAEDFADPEGYASPIPHGHVRITHMSPDAAHYHEDVPFHEIGNHIADAIEESNRNYDDAYFEDNPEAVDEHERLLNDLRKSPYEVRDTEKKK